MHCFSADVVDFSVPVPSVQKNSGNIGAMQWPPESQLSLNVSRVYAKHSFTSSLFNAVSSSNGSAKAKE